MMELRAHHILCTSLFQGKGYSEGFCRGMEQMVEHIAGNPQIQIRPVCCPDAICSSCPHLTEKNDCDSNDNHVVVKDQKVMEALKLYAGRAYLYEELQQKAAEMLDEEKFYSICNDCEWYELGLCSYEKMCKAVKR